MNEGVSIAAPVGGTRSSAALRLGMLLVLSFTTMAARAQAPTSPPAASPSAAPPQALPSQTIEVTGTVDAQRRDATASKLIVTRQDIARFGDANVSAVLGRVPGVVVTGGGSQGVEISLRGLTGGYTAILVNGEKMPSGYAVDSLSPDLIERIEIVRTPTADMSAQGIAGVINIILRRPAATQNTLSLRASTSSGLGSAGVTHAYSRKDGAHTVGVTTSVALDRDELPSFVDVRSTDADGTARLDYTSRSTEQHRKTTLNVAPRWVWKPDDAGSWTVDAVLQAQQWDYRDAEFFERRGGAAAPRFDADEQSWDWRMLQARGGVAWTRQFGEATKVDAKLGASWLDRRFDSTLVGRRGGQPVLERTIGSNLRDTSLTTVAKATHALDDAHTLALGWDAQFGSRYEDRRHREDSAAGLPTLNFDEAFDADVQRAAVFAQHEWAWSAAASVYWGLRAETIRTRTKGDTLEPVSLRSTVASPTLQWRWQLPAAGKDTPGRDQLRVSLGRTYKPPTTRDLIPRRWIVVDNAATNPHFQGNPDLRPELAWGVDAAYERYGPGNLLLAANVNARRIRDVILLSVFQDADGAWSSTPVNRGTATSWGLELEAKGRLTDLVGVSAPRMDLRAAYGVNRSRVDAVPGPGNLLAQQVPWTLTLGVDMPLSGGWSAGAGYVQHGTRWTRTSDRQTVRQAPRRSADLYAAWQPKDAGAWRFALTNLGARDGGKSSRYDAADGAVESRDLRFDNPTQLRITYDLRF